MSKQTTTRLPLREAYVPRHIRLRGGDYDPPIPYVAMREISEIVPILGDNNSVVAEKSVVVLKPAHECMKPFKREDFLIDALISSGVPLTEVNFELCSRHANDALVAKALSLGILSEEFAVPVSESPVVEPSKSSENG